MTYDPGCFLRHIDACTNAVLPGRRARLRIGGAEVGWVLPDSAPAGGLRDQAAFDLYVGALAGRGAFQARGEVFDVRDDATGAVVAGVDRGAIPMLGIGAAGVHVNGLVRRDDGLHLWVGRRAADKKLDPGKLDHMTAGGIATGETPASTLAKEGAEEASLPPALSGTARAAGTLTYAMERGEGLRRDTLYCYDLFLPTDFTPRPNDGEVAGFALWPIAAVVARVAETEDFKFNVNLVLIDLFLRLGVIGDAAVVEAMRKVKARPGALPLDQAGAKPQTFRTWSSKS